MADEPVDWDLARRVAVRVAGEEPLSRSYLGDMMRRDFSEFTPLAEELVAKETGLVSTEGAARAVVIDRAGWINACLLYTSPSPRDLSTSRMPSSA